MNTKVPLLCAALMASALVGCEMPTSPLADAGLQASQAPVATARPAAAEMNRLLADIRSATAQFHSLDVAEAAGYGSTHECASNPFGPGAMGVHFIHPNLLFSDGEAGTFDPLRPEVLVYEPQENGRMRLVAVEYLIFKDAWVAAGNSVDVAPTLLGQEFVRSFGPEAHGLPDHYELHVWLWRHNPDGLFAQWNPQVSCSGYREQE